jgi:hypothetical protein
MIYWYLGTVVDSIDHCNIILSAYALEELRWGRWLRLEFKIFLGDELGYLIVEIVECTQIEQTCSTRGYACTR